MSDTKVMLTSSIDGKDVKAELNCQDLTLSLTFYDEEEKAEETLVIKESKKLFDLLSLVYDPLERPDRPVKEIRIVRAVK